MDNNFAGMHLIIDANFTEEGKKICSDREMMSNYLDEVTRITGMTLVMPPVALKFPFASETHRLINNLDKDGVKSKVLEDFKEHIRKRDTDGQGVSALSMWLESHCALHSWTDDGYISLDLFSCKEYDYKTVLEFTKEYMKLTRLSYLVIRRQKNRQADIEKGDL